MPSDAVATRYAQALFEKAKAAGQLEPMREQLARIGDALRAVFPMSAPWYGMSFV